MDTLRFSGDREARLLGLNLSPTQGGNNAPKAKVNGKGWEEAQAPGEKGKAPEGLNKLSVRKDDERRSQFNGKYDRVYDEMDKRLGGYKQEIKSLTDKLANPNDKYGNDEEHVQYKQKINAWIDNMKNIYEKMSTGSYANLQKIESCYNQIEDRIAQLEAKLAARGEAVKPTYAERVRDGRTEQFKNSSDFKSVDIHGLSADYGKMEMKPSYFLLRTPANVSLRFGDGMPENGFKSNYGMSNGIKYTQVTEEGARYLNGKTITVMVYEKETNAADAESRGVKGTEMKAMITRDAGENGNLVFTLEKATDAKPMPAPEPETPEPAAAEAKVASPLKPDSTPSIPEKDTKQADKERMAALAKETDAIVADARKEIGSGNGFSRRNGVKRGLAAIEKEMAEHSARDQSGVDGTDSRNMRYIALQKLQSEFRALRNQFEAEDKAQEGKDKLRAELRGKTDAAVATADKTLSLKTNSFDTRRDLGAAMKAITDEMEELSKQGLASKEKVKVGRYEDIRAKYNAYEDVLRDMRDKDITAEQNREKLNGLRQKTDQAIGSAEVSIADGEKRAALETAMNAITAELTEYSAQKITSTERAQIPRIEDLKKTYNKFDAMAKDMDAAAKSRENLEKDKQNVRDLFKLLTSHLETGHIESAKGEMIDKFNAALNKLRELDKQDMIDELDLSKGVNVEHTLDGADDKFVIRYDVTKDTVSVEEVKTVESKPVEKKAEKPAENLVENLRGGIDQVKFHLEAGHGKDGNEVGSALKLANKQFHKISREMDREDAVDALKLRGGVDAHDGNNNRDFKIRYDVTTDTLVVEDVTKTPEKKTPSKKTDTKPESSEKPRDLQAEAYQGYMDAVAALREGKSVVDAQRIIDNTTNAALDLMTDPAEQAKALDAIVGTVGKEFSEPKFHVKFVKEAGAVKIEDLSKPADKPADKKPESVDRTSETVLGEIDTALRALGTSIMDQGPKHPETVALLEALNTKATEAAELNKGDAMELHAKMDALIANHPELGNILSGDARTYSVVQKDGRFDIKDVTKVTPPAKPAERPAAPAKPTKAPESREATDVAKLREATEKARTKIDDVTRDAVALDGKFDKADAENIIKAIDDYVKAAEAEFNKLMPINDEESETRKMQLKDGIAKQTTLKEQLTANYLKPAETPPAKGADAPSEKPKEATVSPEVQKLIEELQTILKALEAKQAPAKSGDSTPSSPEKPVDKVDRSKELAADIAKLKAERAQVDVDWKTEVSKGYDALHADGDKGFKKLDELEAKAKELDAKIAAKEAELKGLDSKESNDKDIDELIKKRGELTKKVPDLKIGDTAGRTKLLGEIADIDGKLKGIRVSLDTKMRGLTADKQDDRKPLQASIKKIDDALNSSGTTPEATTENPDTARLNGLKELLKGLLDGVDVKGDAVVLTLDKPETRDAVVRIFGTKAMKLIAGMITVEKDPANNRAVQVKSFDKNFTIIGPILKTILEKVKTGNIETIIKDLDK